jgi:hypothetical protein
MFRTILASAALLAFVGPALAGGKTDPRCANYGEGFVYAPETGFCIKVSGEVRADYTGNSRGDSSGPSIKGSLDARSNTDLGPFRAVIEPRAGRY